MSDRENPRDEHRLVVDRLEGDLVVVEIDGGQVLDMPRWLLPPGVRPGDVLWARSSRVEQGERSLEIRTDPVATRAARDEVQQRLDRLRARDPGGDLAL